MVLTAPAAAGHDESTDAIRLPHEAVSRKVLENGLIILAKEIPSSDLVAIDARVTAGSALEGDYLGSGISHFVEHMLFKGTRSRGPGTIEHVIKSCGGAINASTSHDLTDYRITVPAASFTTAVAVLHDMLTEARFDQAEVDQERDVILKEIRMENDEPLSRLGRRLYETAYRIHPYRYPIVGYEERFTRLRRDDLTAYYRRMYVPNRIVIAVTGGIPTDMMIAAVAQSFKDFGETDYRIPQTALEPAQLGIRTSDEYRRMSLGYLAIAFHGIRLLDEDLYAMDVLAMILGTGDISRLVTTVQKAKELVYSVSAANYTPADPGLFVIQAVLNPTIADAARDAILEEVQRVRSEDVRDDELVAAQRMVVADFILGRETLEAQAGDLASGESLTGNYDFSAHYVAGIQRVTKGDVRRVATRYLSPDAMTVVRLLPDHLAPPPAAAGPRASGTAAAITKETLPNGLRLIIREDRNLPAVAISVAFLGGLLAETEANNGISNLTAAMLLKGTEKRTEREIRGALERLGGSITTFSGANSFGVTAVVLKDDLPTALDIIGDILSHPTFPEDEVRKEKSLTIAAIKNEDDDIFENGVNRLRKELFGKHPYAMRYLGEERSVTALTRQAIADFYASYGTAMNAVVAISGDVATRPLIAQAAAAFGDMKRAAAMPLPHPELPAPKAQSAAIIMDREESLLLIGFRMASIKDPDRYACDLLESVMSGTSGRLFHRLRNKLSLAYALGCAQKQALDAGYLVFYVATTPEKAALARTALMAEIAGLRTGAVGADEFAAAQRETVGSHAMHMQTNIFVARRMALDELYGLGPDDLYRYTARIETVTAGDVARVAKRYLDPAAACDVTVSPK